MQTLHEAHVAYPTTNNGRPIQVRMSYVVQQLEAAVDFIATHNPNFLGQHDYIRNSILEHMRGIASQPDEWLSGTMGYVLWGDREDEGVDSDVNSIRFEISVDPALGRDYDEDTYSEEIINV